MIDLIRGAVVLAAIVGSSIDAQTGSVVVLVSLTLLLAAAVVATHRSMPIPVSPGAQHVLALRARGAVLVRPSRTSPTLRRRHRARAPGHAA